MSKGWSFKDDRRVMELARSSKTLDEIAKAMDVTPDRIRKVAVRLGVSVRSKPTGNEMTGKVRSPKIS
jgi:DNA-directed RNA polymerase sigma subunit (sigma70/sigma32)